MSRLDKAVIQMELQKVHDKGEKLTGKDITLFRPPYGDYNNQVVEMARFCSMRLLLSDSVEM